MSELPPKKKAYRAGDKYDKIIDELIQERGGGDNAYLIHEMITTALKLIDENASRGDLKIINTALKELRYAFKIFAPYRGIRKVSVFGSARSSKKSGEYRSAREFARKIVEKGYMVITGGASGVMEAANAGAGPGKSFGINIRLPFEQEANPYIREDKKLINFKYFFTRKLIFIKESDAIVLFPGGFGTHDEGFEALTLIQTGKSQLFPLVMVDHPDESYWDEWQTFVKHKLFDRGYVSPEDAFFFKVAKTPDEAVEVIETFYRNYHSSRYVGDLFVLRVQRAPKKLITELNSRFTDIVLGGGRFEAAKALPEEALEGREMELPRIVFPFNRKSYGRVREAIDLINRY